MAWLTIAEAFQLITFCNDSSINLGSISKSYLSVSLKGVYIVSKGIQPNSKIFCLQEAAAAEAVIGDHMLKWKKRTRS